MDHSEFRIGAFFYTGTTSGPRKWQITDVGTRTIAAIRVDSVEICRMQDGRKSIRVYTEDGARTDGIFSGPPYLVSEVVFDEYDLPGCHRSVDDI